MHLRRPSAARVQPVPEALDEARAAMADSPVNAVNVVATMAHSDIVQKGVGRFANQVMFRANTEPRLREIVILRMGWNCQAQYEFGQHTLFGRDAGLSEQEIYDTTRPVSQGSWSDEEATLLQMVDDLYADDCVSDQTWAELTARYDTSLVMEYVASALCYRVVSGFLNTCGVELDEGVPGWPSDPSAG